VLKSNLRKKVKEETESSITEEEICDLDKIGKLYTKNVVQIIKSN